MDSPYPISRRRPIAHHTSSCFIEFVVLLARNEFDQLSHDLIAADSLGFGVEIGHDAMTQHRQRHLADVVGTDVIAAFEKGSRLAGEDQILAGARTGTPAYEFVDETGTVAFGAAGQAGELQGVA